MAYATWLVDNGTLDTVIAVVHNDAGCATETPDEIIVTSFVNRDQRTGEITNLAALYDQAIKDHNEDWHDDA